MDAYYGQFAGVGEETTWGTPVARNKFALVKPGSFLDIDVPRERHAVIGNRDTLRFVGRARHGVGKLIVPAALDDGLLLKLIKHAMGQVSTTGAGPYTHVFTLKDAAPFTGGAVATAEGLSVELNYQFPDTSLQARLLEGAFIRQWALPIRVDNDVDFDFDLIGEKTEQVDDTAGPTYSDFGTYGLLPKHLAVTLDAGDATTYVEGVTLAVDNQVAPHFTVGSDYTRQPKARGGVRAVTGTISRVWDDVAPTSKGMWDKFLSGATASLTLVLTNGSYSMTILLPKIVYTGGRVDIAEGHLLPHDVPFTAQHDSTDGAIKITVVSPNATV